MTADREFRSASPEPLPWRPEGREVAPCVREGTHRAITDLADRLDTRVGRGVGDLAALIAAAERWLRARGLVPPDRAAWIARLERARFRRGGGWVLSAQTIARETVQMLRERDGGPALVEALHAHALKADRKRAGCALARNRGALR